MEADQKRYTKTELQITVREDAIQWSKLNGPEIFVVIGGHCYMYAH